MKIADKIANEMTILTA